jgi:hypothetical protein
MSALNRLLAAAALAGALFSITPPQASARDASVVTQIGSQRLQVGGVRSLAALRYDKLVRQTKDVSCGAAALATVLHYYYGRDVSEQQVIDGIMAGADPDTKARIAAGGFSLLELKRFAELSGFIAGGFKLPSVDKLSTLRAPAISLINMRGYNHFVVIRKLDNGRVSIANPAFGNRVLPAEEFARNWSGVILVVIDPKAPEGDQTWRDYRGFNIGVDLQQRPLQQITINPIGRTENEY